MEITDTTTIDAPIERVWDLTLGIDRLPEITPTISAVERLDDGPLGVGSRARLKQPGMPARTWTVEEVDAPHRFAWTTRLVGVRMTGIHDLERLEQDRCRLTLRIRFEGRGAGLLGRLSSGSIASALAAENAGFTRAAASMPA